MSLTEELSTLTAAPRVAVPLVNVAEVAVVGKEVAVDVGREEEDCVAGTTDTRRRFLGGNSILLAPFGVESKEDFPDQWFFRGGTKVLKWLQMYNMATNLENISVPPFTLYLYKNNTTDQTCFILSMLSRTSPAFHALQHPWHIQQLLVSILVQSNPICSTEVEWYGLNFEVDGTQQTVVVWPP